MLRMVNTDYKLPPKRGPPVINQLLISLFAYFTNPINKKEIDMKNNAEVKQAEKMIEPIMGCYGEDFYWPIKDVCRLLEFEDVDQAIAELESDEKDEIMDGPDPNAKRIVFVNMDGMFSLLLKGKAPIAKEFRRWVTRELLYEVLLGKGLLHNVNWTVKEKLITSGFLPDWDMY
jgi:hypothetical protein